MNQSHRNTSGKLWTGLILIILGIIFLIDNYNLINFNIPSFVFQWESILIIIGIVLLFSSRNRIAGSILIVIGLLGFFPDFWPIVLVIIGVYFILKSKPREKTESNRNKNKPFNEGGTDLSEDYIDEVAVFGSGIKNIISDNFKGGRITAIFGGSEINLNRSKLAKGENTLEIIALFGSTTLIVPQEWKINIKLIPIFGGFSDKRMKNTNLVYQNDSQLIIRGLVLFGGGEIKDY